MDSGGVQFEHHCSRCASLALCLRSPLRADRDSSCRRLCAPTRRRHQANGTVRIKRKHSEMRVSVSCECRIRPSHVSDFFALLCDSQVRLPDVQSAFLLLPVRDGPQRQSRIRSNCERAHLPRWRGAIRRRHDSTVEEAPAPHSVRHQEEKAARKRTTGVHSGTDFLCGLAFPSPAGARRCWVVSHP